MSLLRQAKTFQCMFQENERPTRRPAQSALRFTRRVNVISLNPDVKRQSLDRVSQKSDSLYSTIPGESFQHIFRDLSHRHNIICR